MKRVFSVSKKADVQEPVEGAVDYSELSESILTNQIKADLEKIQRYAKQAASYITYQPIPGCYEAFSMAKEYMEEAADCFDALHKKMRAKERKR